MDIPILQTKLYIPQAGPGELIARPRLTQRLNEVLTRKLTLVSAPAGSGKTTLVSQWLSHLRFTIDDLRLGTSDQPEIENRQSKIVNPQVAWLSLDEGDNDPVRFWTYVIAALEIVQAGIGATVLPLLHSPQPPSLEVVLTFLLNDLATLPAEVVLVLDDYHLIENSDIHAALILLLDRLPPCMHLILTSRADPPLPLARWRAKRQLIELRAEALRFTPDEVDFFLNHLGRLNLTAEQVAALEAKTEGWAVGLQLAALSLQGRTDIDHFITAFTGTHRYILDYMTEEILHRQPESVQSFLLQTAILERLTGPLCDAVTGRADSQVILEQLARANLFILPLDDQGQWYRYHRLFADLLRHHLQQIPPTFPSTNGGEKNGHVAELHRRAAAWYEQAGLVEAAIQHTIAAQDFEWAGRLIMRDCKMMIDRGGTTLLLRWLKTFPATWLQSQLKLNVLYAWLLFLTGNFEAVQRKLAELELAGSLNNGTSIEPDESDSMLKNRDLPGLITGLQAQMTMIKGDLPRARALAEQALAQLSREDPGPRSLIAQNLLTIYWLTGEVEKANQLLGDLGEAMPTSHDPAALFALSNMAELKRVQGQHRQAATLYRRVLQLGAELEKPGLSLITGPAHTELGFLLYEWNELAEAETHLRRGIDLGHQGAGLRALIPGYLGLSQILLRQGNFAAVLEIIEQVEQLAQNLDSRIFLSLAALLRVNLWLAQGNKAAITRWRQSSGLQMDDELDGLHAFLIYTGLARALIAEGELDAAVKLLPRLLTFMETTQWIQGIIQILALQAITWQAQHKLEPALAALQRALTLAEPEGYIRSFVDEGAPMAALLERMKAEGGGMKEYVRKLLAAFEQDVGGKRKDEKELIHPSSLIPHPSVESLTEREREVLQLLTTGLSGQEIADQLVITRGTLKTHLKRIYDKLQVNSRAQAVVKGKALNLL
jgi:LuxR family maltose regulon positive regulatory protein